MKTMLAALAISLGAVACANTPTAAPTPDPVTTTAEASPEALEPEPTDSPSVSTPADNPARSACLHYSEHQFEVCTSYVVNASIEARLPFYKSGRSTGVGYYKAVQENCPQKSDPHTLAVASKCRMFSRYYGDARAQLERQNSAWPAEVDVDLPRIAIDSIDVDLGGNTATLHTIESWSVRDRVGKALFIEEQRPHTITMTRTQGLALHKWVVTRLN